MVRDTIVRAEYVFRIAPDAVVVKSYRRRCELR